ncbi:MAG: hypothetical protein AAFR99_21635, partial [Cyanobacteria bacterium J06629_9]
MTASPRSRRAAASPAAPSSSAPSNSAPPNSAPAKKTATKAASNGATVAPQNLSAEDLGVPERLAKHTVRYADYRDVAREALTPMMRHYADIKDEYPHALLMYRVGDFFETYVSK